LCHAHRLQSIPLSFRHARRRRPILVIGPASVLANWQRELSTWGAFRTGVYHGGADARGAALAGVLQGRTEVLITSSTTYRRAAHLKTPLLPFQ
jgi:SNF2 family DNA or RNA helicase